MFGDAETLREVLARCESDGYTGQFRVAALGQVVCLTCHGEHPASRVTLEATCRVEDDSDPDSEMLVAAMVCPCGGRGTEVFTFGPSGDGAESAALRSMQVTPSVP